MVDDFYMGPLAIEAEIAAIPQAAERYRSLAVTVPQSSSKRYSGAVFMSYVLGLLVSFALGIVANLCTPWVQKRLETRSPSRIERRIKRLKNERKLVADYHEGASGGLVAYVGRVIIMTIGNFALAVLLNIAAFIQITSSNPSIEAGSGITAVLGWISLGTAIYSAMRWELWCRRVYDFESYKKRVDQELSQLEGKLMPSPSSMIQPQQYAPHAEDSQPDEK